MIDLGKSHDSIAAEPLEKGKKYYPSVSVPLDMVKGKSIGDMCRFEIVVKVTGMSERAGGGDANLELRKAKYLGKFMKATKEEYIKMSDDERSTEDNRMMDIEDAGMEEEDDEE